MEKIEYSPHVINICLKLRYEFEGTTETMPYTRSIKFKSHMWKLFLDEKLRAYKINKYIHDVCLEEFLNTKDYTKEKIEERRSKRVKENE